MLLLHPHNLKLDYFNEKYILEIIYYNIILYSKYYILYTIILYLRCYQMRREPVLNRWDIYSLR